jgi:hypothetical protein
MREQLSTQVIDNEHCSEQMRSAADRGFNLAKVGVEGSNPFARSRQSPAKLSPPKFEPSERPAFGRYCASGLGFQFWNDTRILSPDGVLSPKLGSRRIYSTSFFALSIKAFKIYSACKVGVPFPPRTAWRTVHLDQDLELHPIAKRDRSGMPKECRGANHAGNVLPAIALLDGHCSRLHIRHNTEYWGRT